MPSVVLITGVSRFLGSRLAAQLAADPAVERVIGIDTVPPRTADLAAGPSSSEQISATRSSPRCSRRRGSAPWCTPHCCPSPHASGARVPMQEMNVIGTMQLLAACQKSDSVTRVVLRSTTAVYGCGADDPAVFTEDMRPRGDATPGYPKDAAEVEAYVRGFARRRPDVEVSMLRLAQLIGPSVDTALTRYLGRPLVPTLAGFDPRLQLLHEADAVEVLRLATVSSRPGVVNVAGEGVITLAQFVRRAGRMRVPVPAAALGVAGRLVGNGALAELAGEQACLVKFGRAVDTTRLRTEFGYTPRYTTSEAADSYLHGERSLPRLALAALGVGSELIVARRTCRLAVTGAREGA